MYKKYLASLIPLALMADMNRVSYGDNWDRPEILSPEEKQRRKDMADINYKSRKGLKRFEFNGIEVWARDEKNAIRKAKNQGLINKG